MHILFNLFHSCITNLKPIVSYDRRIPEKHTFLLFYQPTSHPPLHVYLNQTESAFPPTTSKGEGAHQYCIRQEQRFIDPVCCCCAIIYDFCLARESELLWELCVLCILLKVELGFNSRLRRLVWIEIWIIILHIIHNYLTKTTTFDEFNGNLPFRTSPYCLVALLQKSS